MTMSQRIYSEEQINQLESENESLQAKEDDFIVYGYYEQRGKQFIRVPKGVEICFISNEEYIISDKLVKQLKAQNKIQILGYFRNENFIAHSPVIYKEGEWIPNYIMRAFPRGMISKIGTSHIQGIYRDMSVAELCAQIQPTNSDQKIRCFWTANKMTNKPSYPQLYFK